MHLETRVRVTGGAGFLGSHLCERLLEDGAGVLCVDNSSTGARRKRRVRQGLKLAADLPSRWLSGSCGARLSMRSPVCRA
jgi:nucleoside-diphosphate-sugar epimerase